MAGDLVGSDSPVPTLARVGRGDSSADTEMPNPEHGLSIKLAIRWNSDGDESFVVEVSFSSLSCREDMADWSLWTARTQPYRF